MENSLRIDQNNDILKIEYNFILKSQFEIEMLANNSTSTIVLSSREVNNETTLFGSITNLENVKTKYKNGINCNEILVLINDIKKIIEFIKNHLLDVNNIIIDPQYIYHSRIENTIKFCYVPFWKDHSDEKFSNQIKNFIEWLIKIYDHEDVGVSEAIYELYKVVLKKDFDVNNYMDYVDKINKINTNMNKNIIHKDKSGKSSYIELKEEKTQKNMKSELLIKDESLNDKILEENTEKNIFKADVFSNEKPRIKKHYIYIVLLGVLGLVILYSTGKMILGQISKYNIIALVIALILFGIFSLVFLLKEDLDEGFELIESEKNPQNEYTLISHDMKFIIKILKNITLVGRQKDLVDFHINKSYISRKHLLIKYEEGNLYLKDLESKNGTFINNKKIDNNRYYQVYKNDIILIGEMYFTIG